MYMTAIRGTYSGQRQNVVIKRAHIHRLANSIIKQHHADPDGYISMDIVIGNHEGGIHYQRPGDSTRCRCPPDNS